MKIKTGFTYLYRGAAGNTHVSVIATNDISGAFLCRALEGRHAGDEFLASEDRLHHPNYGPDEDAVRRDPEADPDKAGLQRIILEMMSERIVHASPLATLKAANPLGELIASMPTGSRITLERDVYTEEGGES